MLLSQLRWLGALAIGVAVMIAMYLDPAVEAPGGRPAPPAPTPVQTPSSPGPQRVAPDARVQLDAYETARQALIENTPEGPVRDSALAALRQQYFPEADTNRPLTGSGSPDSP